MDALRSLHSTGERLAQGPGASIRANIKLVSVCMQALPRILAGPSLHIPCLCPPVSAVCQVNISLTAVKRRCAAPPLNLQTHVCFYKAVKQAC